MNPDSISQKIYLQPSTRKQINDLLANVHFDNGFAFGEIIPRNGGYASYNLFIYETWKDLQKKWKVDHQKHLVEAKYEVDESNLRWNYYAFFFYNPLINPLCSPDVSDAPHREDIINEIEEDMHYSRKYVFTMLPGELSEFPAEHESEGKSKEIAEGFKSSIASCVEALDEILGTSWRGRKSKNGFRLQGDIGAVRKHLFEKGSDVYEKLQGGKLILWDTEQKERQTLPPHPSEPSAVRVKKLNSLSWKNLRCLNDQTIELSPRFNLLYGRNGVGKTTVFEAMLLALSHKSQRINTTDTNHLREVLGNYQFDNKTTEIHLEVKLQQQGNPNLSLEFVTGEKPKETTVTFYETLLANYKHKKFRSQDDCFDYLHSSLKTLHFFDHEVLSLFQHAADEGEMREAYELFCLGNQESKDFHHFQKTWEIFFQKDNWLELLVDEPNLQGKPWFNEQLRDPKGEDFYNAREALSLGERLPRPETVQDLFDCLIYCDILISDKSILSRYQDIQHQQKLLDAVFFFIDHERWDEKKHDRLKNETRSFQNEANPSKDENGNEGEYFIHNLLERKHGDLEQYTMKLTTARSQIEELELDVKRIEVSKVRSNDDVLMAKKMKLEREASLLLSSFLPASPDKAEANKEHENVAKYYEDKFIGYVEELLPTVSIPPDYKAAKQNSCQIETLKGELLELKQSWQERFKDFDEQINKVPKGKLTTVFQTHDDLNSCENYKFFYAIVMACYLHAHLKQEGEKARLQKAELIKQRMVEVQQFFQQLHVLWDGWQIDYCDNRLCLKDAFRPDREEKRYVEEILSAGQRIALGLSLFLHANILHHEIFPVLFFDEPVNQEDEVHLLNFLDLLREMMEEHDLQIFFSTSNNNIRCLIHRKFSYLNERLTEFNFERSSGKNCTIKQHVGTEFTRQ